MQMRWLICKWDHEYANISLVSVKWLQFRKKNNSNFASRVGGFGGGGGPSTTKPQHKALRDSEGQ